jgi:hypothetical protein
MSIVLPTAKVAPECKSPKNLIIFSKPKIGKTSLLSTLENCLILDQKVPYYSNVIMQTL